MMLNMKSLVPWRRPEDVFGPVLRHQDLSNTTLDETQETAADLDTLETAWDFNVSLLRNFSDFNKTFDDYPQIENWPLSILLYVFCVFTVAGNGMVILAVIQTRSLHSATNYLIVSLAVADMLVGLVVMPFSATYEGMNQAWVFGLVWCELWRSLDVLASTASILNLCVISLDRYWAITDPFAYPNKMCDKKACLLILTVWICSSIISFPAIFWWRSTSSGEVEDWKCPFTEDIGYLIFSSTVSFYGPLAVMVFTYIKIFKAARAYTQSLTAGTKQLSSSSNAGEITLRIHRGGGQSRRETDSEGNPSPVNRRKRKISRFYKEAKAAKTLGTVMGVFIICWLPFFLVNIVAGFCSTCIKNPDLVFAVVTWLGWINSGMNPIIYACCSKEFRRAFTQILTGIFGKYCCLMVKNRISRTKKFSTSSMLTAGNGSDESTRKILTNTSAGDQDFPKKAVASVTLLTNSGCKTVAKTPSIPSNNSLDVQRQTPTGGNQRLKIKLGDIKISSAERYLISYRSEESTSSLNCSLHSFSSEEKFHESQAGLVPRKSQLRSCAGNSCSNFPPPNARFVSFSQEKLL